MIYKPSKTGKQFHLARNVETGFVRGLMGPIGSGKSVTCVLDLLMISMDQEPDENGVRRSRHAIIRNTYRELLDTTVETFFTWIDRESGHWSKLGMVFILEQTLPDKTKLYVEFLFRALDKPDDIKKLLSLELTAAWINEAREIAKPVVDMVQGRVGRYPPKILGPEATFFGLIMDTNPPDNDHWWYTLFEETNPDNHTMIRQPSGVSKDAENVQNLPRNYYTNMQQGKNQEWINVYVHGKYGFVSDGKPVWPDYNDDVHYSSDIYKPDKSITLYVGIDFGLTPAATIGQFRPSGQLIIFDELVTFDMGAVSFGRLLRQKLSTTYPEHVANGNIDIYADPAGDQRAQTDETTPFQMLQHQGINAFPTYTNDPIVRIEVVGEQMRRLDFNAQPAFMVTSGAPTLRKALSGGYKYRRMQVTGESRFMDKPDKGRYSHVADSLQYLSLGALGGDRVMGGYSTEDIDYSQVNMGII